MKTQSQRNKLRSFRLGQGVILVSLTLLSLWNKGENGSIRGERDWEEDGEEFEKRKIDIYARWLCRLVADGIRVYWSRRWWFHNASCSSDHQQAYEQSWWFLFKHRNIHAKHLQGKVCSKKKNISKVLSILSLINTWFSHKILW